GGTLIRSAPVAGKTRRSGPGPGRPTPSPFSPRPRGARHQRRSTRCPRVGALTPRRRGAARAVRWTSGDRPRLADPRPADPRRALGRTSPTIAREDRALVVARTGPPRHRRARALSRPPES